MSSYFLLALFSTLLITRLSAHILHDRKGYKKSKEKSKTITGKLRILLQKDIHHIHFGLLLLPLAIFFILFTSILGPILLGISLSLITDQLIPYLDKRKDYFHPQQIVTSIILHLLIATIAIILTNAF